MKKTIVLSIVLILFTILSSCKKEESDELILSLSPSQLHFAGEIGDYKTITIEATSVVSLNKLNIAQNINNKSSSVLLDSALYIKELKYNYIYQIPELEEFGENEITITVTINDKNGNERKEARIIKVNNEERALEETAGNEMFSKLASNKNAYDLINQLPLNYLTANVKDKHIEDNTVVDTLLLDSSLSRTWISPANIKFVRFNNFDYANATNSSVKSAYETGIKLDYITNITDNDIILTYIPSLGESNGYYAIKVIFVIDDVGVEQDKYIFNFKHW